MEGKKFWQRALEARPKKRRLAINGGWAGHPVQNSHYQGLQHGNDQHPLGDEASRTA